MPLKFPDHPEAYEIRLIDDESDFYKPFYEVGALDRREALGDHGSLAFVQVKNFKPKGAEIGVDKELIEALRK